MVARPTAGQGFNSLVDQSIIGILPLPTPSGTKRGDDRTSAFDLILSMSNCRSPINPKGVKRPYIDITGTNIITSNDNKYLKQHIYCQNIISTHKQWHNYVITYNYLCHSYHIRVQCQGYRKIIDCHNNRQEKWTFLLALRTNTNLSFFVLFFCSYNEREKRSVHVSPDSGESCLCFVNFIEFPIYI